MVAQAPPAHATTLASAGNNLPVVQVLAPTSEGLAARLAQVLGAGYQWLFQGSASRKCRATLCVAHTFL